VKLYYNPESGRPLPEILGTTILKACDYVPPPLVASSQILDLLKHRSDRTGQANHYTLGCEIVENSRSRKVKLSARVLLQYLAGEINTEQFQRAIGAYGEVNNMFKVALDKGQIIENMSIERVIHRDDDWAVIEFKTGDVATSDFTSESWIMRKIKNNRIARSIMLASFGAAIKWRNRGRPHHVPSRTLPSSASRQSGFQATSHRWPSGSAK
jgi:hypothetical protein